MNATKIQVAEYLHDLSRQLAVQAHTAGFDSAAYLLDLVVLEMADAVSAGKRKPKRASAA
jgi:hypothetical protein